MIEQALYEHLKGQVALEPHLATYNGELAVFSQEAPSDMDTAWGDGPQYGRVVFVVDLQGDPARIMGGTLAVDIMCKDGEQYPEEIEPILRTLIHGYFFSNGLFTVAAQWKNSSYFTQPTDHVSGCTLTFDLLGFPVLTTDEPDVVGRINEWTSSNFAELHVINHDALPSTAWKPTEGESAVYWRLVTESPAGWVKDTYSTIWRTATLRCHIFAPDNAAVVNVARNIITGLYACKRLLKRPEAPIMVNRRNTADTTADPLRTGQVTVEATYGVIIYRGTDKTINHINVR